MQVQLAPAAHGEGNITRTLYMFCCTQESCASQTDSWRAFTHLVPKQDSKTTTAQDVSGKAAASAPQALPASATEASQGSAAAAADAWGLASDDWQTLPAKATEASKGSATVGADAWGLASDDWGVSTPEPAEADAAELNSALDQLSMQSCLHPQVPLPAAIYARQCLAPMCQGLSASHGHAQKQNQLYKRRQA